MYSETVLSEEHHKTLLNILRLLVEGGDNTSEFLSLASQYTKLDVPSQGDIIKLYEAVVSGTSRYPK